MWVVLFGTSHSEKKLGSPFQNISLREIWIVQLGIFHIGIMGSPNRYISRREFSVFPRAGCSVKTLWVVQLEICPMGVGGGGRGKKRLRLGAGVGVLEVVGQRSTRTPNLLIPSALC